MLAARGGSLVVAACVVLVNAAAVVSTSFTPPVQVQLRSPWSAPPLLLELLEAAHREEPSSFFQLINHFLNPWVLSASPHAHGSALSIDDATDEQIYNLAEKTMDDHGLLTEPGQRSTWKLSLALRAETAKIASFWQMYETSGVQKRAEACMQAGSWVDFAGKTLCSEAELLRAFDEYAVGASRPPFPPITALDHVFAAAAASELSDAEPVAVLYADPFAANFWELHNRLMEFALGARADHAPLRYVLRWKPTVRKGSASLSGYGAYLDLKKVDYLVIDDRKLVDTAAARQRTEEDSRSGGGGVIASPHNRRWLNEHLRATNDDLAQSMGNLTAEEVQSLDIRAAYAIVQSSDPIRAMKQLAQDFPSHAVALARHAAAPPQTFIDELDLLQSTRIEAGGEDVWMNGKALNGKDFQPFGLLSALRAERALVAMFSRLGLSSEQTHALLTNGNVSKAYISDTDSATPPIFDASDRIERRSRAETEASSSSSGPILYWNDLEATDDPRYAHWPSELTSLLRPLYPGTFPRIRRNVFNVILAMDLERLDAVTFLSDSVQMATNKVAIRWGFVPINLKDTQSTSSRMAELVWLAFDQLGPAKTAKFLRRVAMVAQQQQSQHVNVQRAGEELDKLLHTTPTERSDMLKDCERYRHEAQAWTRRLRADEHATGSVFVNGQHYPFHPQILQMLHQVISMQLQALAPAIYFGQIDDDEETDMANYHYDLPTSFSARTELLFPPDDGSVEVKAVELKGEVLSAAEKLLVSFGGRQTGLSVWLFGDFTTTEKGQRFLKEVLFAASKRFDVRLGVVPTKTTQDALVMRFCRFAGTEPTAFMDDDDAAVPPLHDDLREACESAADAFSAAVGVGKNKFGILINGRLLANFDPDDFSSTDYDALIGREAQKVATVKDAMPAKFNATQVLSASSLVHAMYFVDATQKGFFVSPTTARTSIVDQIDVRETSFSVGDAATATVRFTVLIDPLGKNVQSWSSTIAMLAEQPDVFVRVLLNPLANVTEVPLKRYFRANSPSRPTFNQFGSVEEASLTFHDMPNEAVLTMGLDAPPAWLTMPIEAIYDLDNILLRDAVTTVVRAVYELKYILIEGHVRDEALKVTPRGLQLVLETIDGQQTLDTIVMANLAYFQFRAAPGSYRLRIRSGRSAELYDLQSVGSQGWHSPSIEQTGDGITFDTLQGLTIFPRVAKKAGKEKEQLVEDGGGETSGSGDGAVAVAANAAANVKGIFQRATQGVFASFTGNNATTAAAAINVFTVASGHLYERMTYIMVLSTLKHTNQTVKFWFIENFLSPSFKSFIPLLAQEYGFQYELVTYAWPHWLRGQSEKQRSIWGMKVLFLDVLFPLDLSKVIFVDADQIVRADLMELTQLDLHGAPYGFPPMGNDSYDMDNFRFWETGYWNNFLRGKPYPISALFVVDLNRFRRVAAGDKLRGHYQALSADPNSLSNLDQDLVASMIHNVPIFSLPKEWLWCETWCSWSWYDDAKSIDLCSNPKTHEPKLDRARRQIPEWTPLDEEVADLARRLEGEGRLGANVVASSSHVAAEPAAAAKDSRSRHDEL